MSRLTKRRVLFQGRSVAADIADMERGLGQAPTVESVRWELCAEEELRRLLSEGFRAETAMQAALVVAAVVSECLGADRAVVLYFGDAERTRVSAATVGVAAEIDRAVRELAARAGAAKVRPPGWTRAATSAEILAVDDVAASPGVLREGGIGQALGLGSFVGIPLLVDDEPVGRVTCGWPTAHRWTPAERNFASRVVLEASVVMETARLREAEQATQRVLEYRATHDPLTGLANRAEFERRLAAALDDRRGAVGMLGVLLLDLDGFKGINDTLGHQAGDRLLAAAAARIRSCVRDTDLVARLGGDEFTVLLPAATAADAEASAARIAAALAEPFEIRGAMTAIGASIGVALAPQHADDPAGLVGCADVAMYRAKRAQASVAVYSTDSDTAPTTGGHDLAGELRRALSTADGGLDLRYQPIIDLATGEATRVEGLVYWQHPRLGLLAPAQLRPVADAAGLLRPLTGWIVESAVTQAARWRAAGSARPVAINITSRDLADPAFPATVAAGLHTYGVAAGQLTVELAESAVARDPRLATATLAELHNLGIRISLEDYGAGHSCLPHLHDLPIDELKLDPAFVVDDGPAPVAAALADLGHRLGCTVVATGITDSAALERAQRLGADHAQGDHLAPPLPADQLTASAVRPGGGILWAGRPDAPADAV